LRYVFCLEHSSHTYTLDDVLEVIIELMCQVSFSVVVEVRRCRPLVYAVASLLACPNVAGAHV